MFFSFLKYFSLLIIWVVFSHNTQSIDFGSQKDGNNWVVINDGVMGGLSKGNAYLNENSILLQGEISFANNGGFSSLRSSRINLNVEKLKYIEIKYRLKGLSFALMLEQNYRFYMPYYSYPIETTEEKWVVKRIPINEFYETRLGEYTGRLLDVSESKNFIRIGFISREKKAQKFELEVDYIKLEYSK